MLGRNEFPARLIFYLLKLAPYNTVNQSVQRLDAIAGRPLTFSRMPLLVVAGIFLSTSVWLL